MLQEPSRTNDVPTIVEVDVSDTEAMTAWANAATSQRDQQRHRAADASSPGPADSVDDERARPCRGCRGRRQHPHRLRGGDLRALRVRRLRDRVHLDMDAARARWLPLRSGSMEIVTPEQVVDVADSVYERARRRHPGAIERTALRWRTVAQLDPGPDPEDRMRQFAVHRDRDGDVDGLLVYKVEDSYVDRVSAATLHVNDLWAANDVAYVASWRFCTEVDFVTRVVAEDRSPDEPLPLLLADPRAARTGPVSDFLWARLHDVPKAFSARRYQVPGRLTLDVRDALGQVRGTYLLEVDDAGVGQCEPLSAGVDQPDITLDAAGLAALWLGSGGTGAMVRAGLVLPRDAATLGRAHALLGWPDTAWCGTWF